MLNRLAAVIITVFWVVMWGLLLRSELEPEEAALREVPVEHVLKLMFHHQQASDLIVHSDGKMIGHLRLIPRTLENEDRLLDFAGGLQLRLPGTGRQRLSWVGESTFTNALDLKTLGMNVTIHHGPEEAVDSRLAFHFDSAARKGLYEVRSGPMMLDRQEFEASEEGIRKLVDRLGMDATMLQTVTAKSGSPPKIRARRSSFKLRDEEIDTLLLTMEYNGQTMLQVHVSQLGRVLHAKTILGWTLESD